MTTDTRWVEVPLQTVLSDFADRYEIEGMTVVRHEAFVDHAKGCVVFKMTMEPAPPATADDQPVCDCPSCQQAPRLAATSVGQHRYECEKCELATYDFQASGADAARAWNTIVAENR